MEEEIDAILSNALQKCDNDVKMFLTHVAGVLKKKTSFFENTDHELKCILNECFGRAAENDDAKQPDNGALEQSITVNVQSINDSVAQANDALNMSANDSLFIDESMVSDILNEDRPHKNAAEQFDDNEEIIPETQCLPEETSIDGHSRPVSRVSSRISFGNNDTDDDLRIPETQYMPNRSTTDDESRPESRVDNRRSVGPEKHVTFASNIEKSFSVGQQHSADTSGFDEDDEMLELDHETNSSWTDQIDASQAVIGDVEPIALGGANLSHHNKILTDSIADLSTINVVDTSKMDVDAPKESASKPNDDASATSRSKENEGNGTVASLLSLRETARSSASTPDLDIFDAQVASAASSPKPETSSAVTEQNVANASQPSKNTAEPIDVDSRSTPDLDTADAPQPDVTSTLANAIDPATVDMNDDSFSNDNELFDGVTQVFQPPPKQPPRVSKRISDISTSEQNEKEVDKNPIAPGETDGAVAANLQPNENVFDDDESNLYAAATQMFSVPSAAKSKVSDRIVAAPGNSSHLPNKSTNVEMGPPALLQKSRKSGSLNEKSNQSVETGFFEAQTQEFMPLATSKPTAHVVLPTAGSSDAIYDAETEPLSTSDNGTKKKRKSSTPPSENQDQWPDNTPAKSIAALFTVKDIEDYARLPKPPKKMLSKKWLFESEPEGEAAAESEPKEKSKADSGKRKAAKTETVASEMPKRVKGEPTSCYDVSSGEIERIKKRRVSVLLDRVNIDENFNENDQKAQQTPKRSARLNNAPADKKSESTSSARKEKSNKNLPRTVSDVTSDRSTRLATRRSNIAVVPLDVLQGRTGMRSESRSATSGSPSGSRGSSRSSSRSSNRSSSRNAVVVAATSSSDRPEAPIANKSSKRSASRSRNDGSSRSTSRNRNAAAVVTTSSSDLPLIRPSKLMAIGRTSSSLSATEGPSGSRSTRSTTSVGTGSDSSNTGTSANPTHRVMFSKVEVSRGELKPAIDYIPKMGGKVTDSPTDCTVLVVEKIYRTNKLLCAVARGIPIVTPDWLIASQKKKRFVDTESYILHDPVGEKRYNFKLRSSLELARNRPLYKNCLFFTTPNIVPPPEEIAAIVKCAGGKHSSDISYGVESKAIKFAISSQSDAKLWKQIRKLHPGIPIISTEGLMRNVLAQIMDFAPFKLM